MSAEEQNLNAAAVVPAAGRGERLGPGTAKALRTLGGAPLLMHAVRALTSARTVSLVVVVAPPDDVWAVRALFDEQSLDEQSPDGAEVRVVAGGADRQESVRRGLDEVPEEIDVVLVHDAARPLVPPETVDEVAAAVAEGAEAVVPALPVPDTVKRVEPRPDGAPEPVLDTPDRSVLRAVQTPQGFARDVLDKAHRAAAPGTPITDDAGLVERAGGQVSVVPGHEHAFKVTRPMDLLLAEAVLQRRKAVDGYY